MKNDSSFMHTIKLLQRTKLLIYFVFSMIVGDFLLKFIDFLCYSKGMNWSLD